MERRRPLRHVTRCRPSPNSNSVVERLRQTPTSIACISDDIIAFRVFTVIVGTLDCDVMERQWQFASAIKAKFEKKSNGIESKGVRRRSTAQYSRDYSYHATVVNLGRSPVHVTFACSESLSVRIDCCRHAPEIIPSHPIKPKQNKTSPLSSTRFLFCPRVHCPSVPTYSSFLSAFSFSISTQAPTLPLQYPTCRTLSFRTLDSSAPTLSRGNKPH